MSQLFEFSEELGSVNKGKLKKSKDRFQDLNGSNLGSFGIQALDPASQKPPKGNKIMMFTFPSHFQATFRQKSTEPHHPPISR